MVSLEEVEQNAMQLSESERKALAANLISSIYPPVLEDADEGLAEAAKRDRELNDSPESGMSLEEFRAAFED